MLICVYCFWSKYLVQVTLVWNMGSGYRRSFWWLSNIFRE